MNAIFLHDYPLTLEPGSTSRPLVQKKTWRDSLPSDMLLSAVSVLVVAQSSSEIPDGLMNNPVLPKGRAAMEDTEDTSSVRISSFQPRATQNYIDILSLSLQLPLVRVITLPRRSKTLPFNKKLKNVKVTLVQALRLCTGRTAHRGSRGIALPFHDHGTRRG